MLNRRFLIAGALLLAFAGSTAQTQSYKSQYPELVFAKVPDENATGTSDRWTPLTNFLSKELGVKVTLRIANDYAAVIEGQRAGNIHIAMYGPASYARALYHRRGGRAVRDRGGWGPKPRLLFGALRPERFGVPHHSRLEGHEFMSG